MAAAAGQIGSRLAADVIDVSAPYPCRSGRNVRAYLTLQLHHAASGGKEIDSHG